MKHSAFKPILSASCLLLVFSSCRPSAETTVVRQSPQTPADDTTEVAEVPEQGEFQQLSMGEMEPIHTMDPMHARNSSSMRAVQLVYEGLVRYGPEGSLEPLLAREWEVEEDSTLYRFSLRRDAFYHDSDIFGSGVGRRLNAGDVKFAIERTGWKSVPPETAEMFMVIEGFEPWLREQHRVFNPELRRIPGVSGITIQNDSTVTFRLLESDPDFLHKLASPHAVIYPREALQSPYPSRFRAVGTGPFSLSRQRGDSVFIFSRNNDWHGENQPDLNRVDLTVFDTENELFQAFANGDIQLIPQAGPQTLGTVTAENGSLAEGYGEEFELHRSDGRIRYALHHNESGPLSRTAADTLLQAIDSTLFGVLAGVEFRMAAASPDTANSDSVSADPASPGAVEDEISAATVDTVYTTYNEDPWVTRLATQWAEQLLDRGVTLQILPIRTHTRTIAVYSESWIPMYRNDTLTWSSRPLLEFSAPAVALTHNRVRNYRQNRFPWWFDLRDTGVPENSNQTGGR